MKSDLSPHGTIIATPNPTGAQDSYGCGITTLEWRSSETTQVEVHLHAPDGQLLTRSGPAGTALTGQWVENDMVFYLQDVSDGAPLTGEHTLGTVRVRVEPLAIQAGIGAFAGFLARRSGCKRIISLGCQTLRDVQASVPDCEIIGIDSPANVRQYKDSLRSCQWIEWDGQSLPIPLPDDLLQRSIVICANLNQYSEHLDGLLNQINGWMDSAEMGILATAPVVLNDGERAEDSRGVPHPWSSALSGFEGLLASHSLRVQFTGFARLDSREDSAKSLLAIVERNSPVNEYVFGFGRREVPDSFRVVAFLTVFNEADIISSSIEHLLQEGIQPYIIDDWSTDGSFELAKQFLTRGVLGVERFPHEGPSPYFHYREILARFEELASTLDANWFLLHGTDEIRRSPWSDRTYREGLYQVDHAGYTAVDHTVLTFPPTDNNFQPGGDMGAYFKHFEFGQHPSEMIEVRAWKNTAVRVALVEFGSHDVGFEGRRVYPLKFLQKHYPIRSQSHGERKILNERPTRWDPAEKAAGWHVHYDHIHPGFNFLRSPEELEFFDPLKFNQEYLIERLTGIGIARANRIPQNRPRGSSATD